MKSYEIQTRGRERETWWSKRAYHSIAVKKRKRHLIEQKGSWFRMEIQRDPIVVYYFAPNNIFYYSLKCFLSSM